MVQINHEQLNKLLKTYYITKKPVYIWGTMGIGKSAIVKQVSQQIAKDNKWEFLEGEPNGEGSFGFIDVRISQLEPSDLRGLPNISENSHNEKVTKWIIPNWLPRDKKSKGILFFDELNLSVPSVTNACYQLIHDRRLGDYVLPDGWIIVCAGNTINDKANIFELSSPLKNRFAHLELKIPNKDEWVKWGFNNGIDANIISFLEFKPSYLYKFDKNNKDNAFPTPRTWEIASTLLKESKNLDNEEKQILVSSAVGDSVGIEFNAFLKLQNKINLKEILDKPEMVKQIKEIDLKYSLLGMINEKYREDKKILEKVLKITEFLEPEFAILLLRFMKTARKDFSTDVVKVKNWVNITNKYGKYLIELKMD